MPWRAYQRAIAVDTALLLVVPSPTMRQAYGVPGIKVDLDINILAAH